MFTTPNLEDWRLALIHLSLSLAFIPALLVSEDASFSAFVQFPLMEVNHNFANLGM